MTTYTFNPQLVADPVTFQRASNASVTVYDSGDTANATPLVLTDMNGLPLANPITSTSDGFLAGFKCPSTQVKLVGGGLTVIANSYQALLDQATAAKTFVQGIGVTAVNTGDPGSSAAVSLDANGQFTFTVPRGDQGEDGPQGLPGINAIPADAAVAAYVKDGTPSATRSALNGAFTAVDAPQPVSRLMVGYNAISWSNTGGAYATYMPVDPSGLNDFFIPANEGDIIAVTFRARVTTAGSIGVRLFLNVPASGRFWGALGATGTTPSGGIPDLPGGATTNVEATVTDRVTAADLTNGYLRIQVTSTNTSGTAGGTHSINTTPSSGILFSISGENRRSERVRVLSPGLSWENSTVQEPSVWVEADGKWWMLYTSGTGQTSYATAPGPYGPWTKRSTYLFAGAHNNVYVENGVKYVYYGGASTNLQVRYGADIESLTLSPTPALTGGSGTPYWSQTNTSVVNDASGTYHMLFETKQYSGGGSGAWLLGHATASSPLGPFTVDTYPLTSLSQASGASVDGPNLFYQNGKFVLIFHASRTAGSNFPTDIFRAESADCINWTMTPATPILTHARMTGSALQDQAADPCAVTDPRTGIAYMFWTGQNNSTQTGGIYCSVPSRFPLSLAPVS